jgi:hypothetical protein
MNSPGYAPLAMFTRGRCQEALQQFPGRLILLGGLTNHSIQIVGCHLDLERLQVAQDSLAVG